jgi:endonuclease YncB( thermonuclease family)
MTKLKLFLITLIAVFSLSTQAEIIRGKVIKIADGDTLTLLADSNKKIRIRLAGIDTPEKKQPFGNSAKKNIS